MIPYFEQPSISLGPVSIHAFGVLLAIAVWLGHRIFRARLQRAGLDVLVGDRLLFWVLVPGFVGAHLVDRLVYFPGETLEDPLSILKIWKGISSFGGFLGAIVGATVFTRTTGALRGRTWGYLDAVAYAFPFGWIFGRTGCFVAFDHPGAPTTFFLGERYSDGRVIHNLGLEEALYTIAVAGLFALLGRRRRFTGFFVGLLPIVYSPFRFILDYLRARDVRYFGLTPAQYGAVALLIVGVLILKWRSAQPEPPPLAPEPAPATPPPAS
jgi:phosphatidylglycerol:prolipoprotein diacylglycerol transferase